jgi:tetratricopeptide (TPR) repeat protein
MTKAPSGKVPRSTPSRQKKKESGKISSSARPPIVAGGTAVAADDEASRLLVDADSFLRLGLVDKAIEHLASAVRRDPSLRALREPLFRLYVSQREYQRAIDELWALLSPCPNPQEEIRFLRYILRLGGKNPAAEQRLANILTRQAALSVGASSDEAVLTRPSVDKAGGALRAHLGRHRPPTDRMLTRDLTPMLSREPVPDAQPAPSAITRPSTDEIEAVAEEIALSSGGLKEQLQEVDGFLQRLRYAEALARLRALSVRYPHSKRVRDRLHQLEQALSQVHIDDEPTPRYTDKKAGSPDIHTATTVPHWAFDSLVKKPVLPPEGATKLPVRQLTIEVDPADIKEERALPPPAPQPRSAPMPIPPQAITPPPAAKSGSLQRPPIVSDAERAIRTGTTMRSFGQHKQAIQVFEKVLDDSTHGAVAALMIGLCYRDLSRHREALAAFMRGVNMRDVNDSVLSELFYELGYTHELMSSPAEAILFYELSLGKAGSYRDAEERIATLHGVFGAS